MGTCIVVPESEVSSVALVVGMPVDVASVESCDVASVARLGSIDVTGFVEVSGVVSARVVSPSLGGQAVRVKRRMEDRMRDGRSVDIGCFDSW